MDDNIRIELDPFGVSEMEGAVNTPAEANRILYIVGKLDEELLKIKEEYDQVIEETTAFYNKRIESKNRAIEFMQSRLEAYVRNTGNNLSLPNGRAYLRQVNQEEWLVDDKELLEFARKYAIKGSIIEYEKPDKRKIKEWIGEGESTVLKRTPVKKFYVQLPKKEDKDEV